MILKIAGPRSRPRYSPYDDMISDNLYEDPSFYDAIKKYKSEAIAAEMARRALKRNIQEAYAQKARADAGEVETDLELSQRASNVAAPNLLGGALLGGAAGMGLGLLASHALKVDPFVPTALGGAALGVLGGGKWYSSKKKDVVARGPIPISAPDPHFVDRMTQVRKELKDPFSHAYKYLVSSEIEPGPPVVNAPRRESDPYYYVNSL